MEHTPYNKTKQKQNYRKNQCQESNKKQQQKILTRSSENEQINIINQINKNDDWIIEGTLRKNLYILLDLADKVIYIDIPLRIRRRRIILRYLKQKLGIEKCNYIPNKEMLKNMFRWTNDYEKEKNKFERNLRKYKDKVEVFNESSENIFKKFIKTLDNI